MYDQQIDKLQASRLTIEQQSMAISDTTVSAQVVQAMRTGSQSLAALHGELYVVL